MRLLYVDTSALFKRYVEEDESEVVLARIEEAPAVGTRWSRALRLQPHWHRLCGNGGWLETRPRRPSASSWTIGTTSRESA